MSRLTGLRTVAVALIACSVAPRLFAHSAHDIFLDASGPAAAAASDPFHWLVTVWNGGLGDPAYGIVLTAQLPSGVTVAGESTGPFNCQESKSTVTCSAESIPAADTVLDFTLVASRAQVTNLVADVQSLGTVDTNPDNNHVSTRVLVFDKSVCSATIVPLAPLANSARYSPVTFSWSPLPFPARYEVFAAEGGSVARSVGTSSATSLTADLSRSDVNWSVEGTSDVCPPIRSSSVRFSSLGGFPWITLNETDGGFTTPWGVAVETSGGVVVSDRGASTIRRIAGGNVTTIAGAATSEGFVDGPAATARFRNPGGIAVARNGSIVIADTGNNAVRVLDGNNVRTLASGFAAPGGVAMDGDGVVYVGDTGNNVIRRIAADGSSTVVAGISGTAGFHDGPASAASFDHPEGLAIDASGAIYVADSGNRAVRKIAGGTVTTVAGGGASSPFAKPVAIAIDDNGNLFVTDVEGHRVVRVTISGEVSTAAGTAGMPGFADGASSEALLDGPAGIAITKDGRVVIADSGNHAVRIGSLYRSPRHRAAGH